MNRKSGYPNNAGSATGVAFLQRGGSTLRAWDQTPDLNALRNQLADKIDRYPPEEWSAPFLVLLIGAFDAHAVAERLETREAARWLRVV